jgi:hypothetical protein
MPSGKIEFNDKDKFLKSMEEYRENSKKAEQEARERPHREFLATALAVGWTEAQAELLWAWFALKHHEHWDGRIG